ncbi:uncharacterized protein N7484_008057 [Penicillium longicatenatum]|uniref:uncharacterized protein n=1 Tax=Penicillium longicatenatum TaxID=1561947 RepID=UPI00254705FD|nr:uncharacterized protein N7484_008057 [Penicillium longicatenatum]KAJ5640195.1 hypothetical protein N7484_008057 [Penicillium longicatenatum]
MARATTMTKTRTVQHETISVPVLTYTDALPRDDLRDINPSERQINHAKQWAFPPTRVADKESKESCSSAKFDFQLTAPPDEPTPTTATSIRSPVGSHTIGIALGSPGLMGSPEALPPPRFNTGIFNEGSEQPRKSSKWKKIGGLFRAKNALTSPTTTRPTPSKDMEPKEKPNTNKATRKEDGSEEWPKIEVEPIVGNYTSPKRSRKFSMSGRKDSKDKGICSPMLDVNIPDVQMERYSVMFSNVMNKNHKPSLLARRSKTLDNLRVPSAQEFLTAKVPPVPQRRATSPAHTRSSFTLFPAAQPSRAQVVGTQNFSRGPSPLLRSNTLPVSPKASPSPRDLPRPLNNNSLSSFESPVIPKLFSGGSNTPVSASSYRREDKPLPAIKPEPPVARSRTVSPQVQVPQPRRTQSDRNMKSVHQVVQPERSATEPTRPIKPTLKVQTELRGPPLPAKDRVTPKSASALSAKMTTREHVNRIMSPAIVQSPMEIKSAPAKEIKAFPVKASKPVVTEREISSPVSQPRKKVSKIEVSTARSISVSKGKRQILVPIGARMEQLNPNERLVEQRAMTPTIMDVQYGHRHGASQELQIESI